MTAVLYISVDCDGPDEAREQLARFTAAGLNPDSSRVHVAIGDPAMGQNEPAEPTNRIQP